MVITDNNLFFVIIRENLILYYLHFI